MSGRRQGMFGRFKRGTAATGILMQRDGGLRLAGLANANLGNVTAATPIAVIELIVFLFLLGDLHDIFEHVETAQHDGSIVRSLATETVALYSAAAAAATVTLSLF